VSGLVHLGLDVGGTASRWVAVNDAGEELSRGKASGATGHLFNPVEKQRLIAAFTAIATEVAATGFATKTLTVGLTGFGPAVRDELGTIAAEIFGVASDATILINDVVLAYVGAFPPGGGHLISAGTGSIGVHIAAGDVPNVRVGGRGILIDDGGSGSWIALRALDAMFREIDRLGAEAESTPLARNLFALSGGHGWDFVRSFVYAGDRGRIGQLAVGVARAADEGDEVAKTILVRAGQELAELAKSLLARIGERPIGYVGGVLKLHPLILQSIKEALPGNEVQHLNADAALTAARLQAVDDGQWLVTLKHKPTID
jgi:glucosamine kinase